MWTALMLVLAVSSSAPATPVEVSPGTKLRLTAGPAVDVPGLYSGTRSSYTTGHAFERRDGLLVFTRDDGSKESLLAPKEVVVGTLVACEGPWIHLLRRGRDLPDRIHRDSLARVEVSAGRVRGGRALKGLGIGAGVGLGVGLAAMATHPTTDGSAQAMNRGLALGAVVVAGAVGLAIGVVSDVGGQERWQEVPRQSLGSGCRDGRDAASPHDATTQTDTWELVSLADDPGITVGVVRRGSLQRAVAALAGPPLGPSSPGLPAPSSDTPVETGGED